VHMSGYVNVKWVAYLIHCVLILTTIQHLDSCAVLSYLYQLATLTYSAENVQTKL
jgi:hypothetical protein